MASVWELTCVAAHALLCSAILQEVVQADNSVENKVIVMLYFVFFFKIDISDGYLSLFSGEAELAVNTILTSHRGHMVNMLAKSCQFKHPDLL